MNLSKVRILSSISATVITLACGTNYVYSAWGPQFAEKLNFSSTEQNVISLSGNLGMYILGIPIGMFVDSNDARITVLYAGFILSIGYFMLYNTYLVGSGYLPLLCLYSFLTGVGGCASFSATVKVSASNWPHSKGTATAFPVAAFGLSAFFFSTFGQIIVSGNTSNFLLLLAVGTVGLHVIGLPFLKIVKPSSKDSKQELVNQDTRVAGSGIDESDVLLSNTISLNPEHERQDRNNNHVPSLPTRGLKLLTRVEFWQLFTLMGILAGISLMTINNIGNNVRALWRYRDESIDEDFIVNQEALQVSIISVSSFVARIASGIGSDFLVKVLKVSRLWCLAFASIIFFTAQLSALTIWNPYLLFLVTIPTGVAYGFLFGCFPSLVSEAFGIDVLAQNFGAMLLSPVISVNAFNLLYGKIFDQQSIVGPNGHLECTKGVHCYQKAYYMTLLASIIGLIVSLWSISYSNRTRPSIPRLVIGDEDVA